MGSEEGAKPCSPSAFGVAVRALAQVGDRVKVLAGQHSGESGLLLSVKDEACVLLSETTKQELKVFAR